MFVKPLSNALIKVLETMFPQPFYNLDVLPEYILIQNDEKCSFL